MPCCAVCVEIMHRLPQATFAVRQSLLDYMLPWLYNMELVESSLPGTVERAGGKELTCDVEPALLKGRGWGSPEATDMILNNLLYTTVTVSSSQSHWQFVTQPWIYRAHTSNSLYVLVLCKTTQFQPFDVHRCHIGAAMPSSSCVACTTSGA